MTPRRECTVPVTWRITTSDERMPIAYRLASTYLLQPEPFPRGSPSPEDPVKLLTSLAHSRGVYNGRQHLQIMDEHIVQQRHICGC